MLAFEKRTLSTGNLEIIYRHRLSQYLQAHSGGASNTWLSLQCGYLFFFIKMLLTIEHFLNYIILCNAFQNVNLLLKALTSNDSSREAPPLL